MFGLLDKIIAFSSERIKSINFIGSEGCILFPLTIPQKVKGLKTEDLFNNTAYFKFNFDILEEEKFGFFASHDTKGIYKLGLYIGECKMAKEK